MHPRWRSDLHGAPIVPESTSDRSPGGAERQSFINEPLPDLEQQLAAELDGASWAVVAFAPEDAAWCDWIYRNLNGYRLPASLVDRVTAQGFPRPDCLSIFPDRRDPAYADGLPRALEASSCLIVVCSPHSTGSETVDDQIRAFKKAGGEERILALVADGPPDARLGEYRRAAQCEWLPAWLRWRLEENGFRAADRAEPRVVDARRGYRSLKQVRDSLLSALVDVDVAELERLGGCAQGVEIVLLSALARVERSPVMTTAVAMPPPRVATPPPSARPPSSKYTIFTAVMLIMVAVIFGTRSFLEITADEPVSTLNVSPVTGVMAGRSAKATAAEEAPSTAETAAVTPEVTPAVAQNTPPPLESVPEAKPVPPVPVALPNVPQVTPPSAWATSKILPTDSQPPPRSGPGSGAVSVITPPSSAPLIAAANAATSAESDSVLLDEVRTLERRGDETMAQKRTEDALDLYHTALDSAEEYATRKGANPNARDQLVALRRKLGLLQMQNSSTAEARATYTQARRTLLQLKSQNQWNRERGKALDEIESRLLSLPRD